MVEINTVYYSQRLNFKVAGRTKNQVDVRIKVNIKLRPGLKAMTVHGIPDAVIGLIKRLGKSHGK
jgi:hypothetical protein